MKLRSLSLQNFLTFGNEKQIITFDNETSIVGPNDVGKTNIFRTISFIAEILRSPGINVAQYYFMGNKENSFRIELEVEFSKEEIDTIFNYLVCSTMTANISPQQGDDSDAITRLNVEVTNKNAKKFFKDFLHKITIIVKGDANEYYAVEPIFKISKDDKNLFIHRSGQITLDEGKFHGNHRAQLGNILFNELRKRRKNLVINYLQNKSNIIPNTKLRISNIFDYCYSLFQNGGGYVSMETAYFDVFERKRLPNPPEQKRLRKFLSEHNFTENAINLEPLISLIFNSAVIRIANLRSKPEGTLTDKTKISLSERFRELSGKDLGLILFDLKNHKEAKYRTMYREISENFAKLFPHTSFDVAVVSRRISKKGPYEIMPVSPSELLGNAQRQDLSLLGIKQNESEEIQHDLSIEIIKNNFSVNLNNSSAGIFDSLLVLTCLLGRTHQVILLDEPALNLHPNLQRRILEIIQKSIRNNKNQVIIITHSPYLIQAANWNNLWRLIQKNGATSIINIEASLNSLPDETRKKVEVQLNNSDIRSVLFSKGIMLVEGITDKLIFENLDRKFTNSKSNSNLDDNEWSIVAMGSKDNLVSFLNITRLLEIPYVAILDGDAIENCTKVMEYNGKSIRTSPIFLYVNQSLELDNTDVKHLDDLQRYIRDDKYSKEKRDILDKIAKKYGIFVLEKDPEHSFKVQINKRESKTLKILDEIIKKISNKEIPKDIGDALQFIHNKVILTKSNHVTK